MLLATADATKAPAPAAAAAAAAGEEEHIAPVSVARVESPSVAATAPPKMRIGVPYRGVIPRLWRRLPLGGRIIVSEGSVVPFCGDCIVNAANTGCVRGGGVDGAIGKAGGKALLAARKALPVLQSPSRGGKKLIPSKKGFRPWRFRDRCHTGDAKITVGGDLNAEWCIHAVGPNYRVMLGLGYKREEADAMLRSAYIAAMRLASERMFKTVAFSLLSTGVFRGPTSVAENVQIGARAVWDGAYEGLDEVHLVAFTDDELKACCAAVRGLGGESGLVTEEEAGGAGKDQDTATGTGSPETTAAASPLN